MGIFTRKKIVPYVLLIPFIVAFSILIAYPLYKVAADSLYKASFLNPSHRQFVGWSNFGWLFSFKLFNPRWSYFVSVLGRTFLWVMSSVSLKVVIGFLGALLLNNKLLIGKKFYRTLVILPWAIPWAMGAMMWAWTFNSQFGVVNSLLLRLHLITEPVTFLANPVLAFLSTVVVDVWAGLPFMFIMLLAGLQAIPGTIYEAASIDGAGALTRVFKITIPLLRPVLFTVSLLSLIWTFNSFDVIWILTGGGPLRTTETLPIAIYKTAFRYLRFGGIGKASAMTVAQVVIVSVVMIFYVKALKHMEAQ